MIMKAELLMAYDWVRSITDKSHYQFYRITKNHECHMDVNEILNFNSDIEPIPLTEEILKANGFESDNYGYFVVESQDIHFWIIRYCEEDGCKHFSGHWVIGEIIPIDYVHELQHALRLCGLNELADNFVIEKEKNNG